MFPSTCSNSAPQDGVKTLRTVGCSPPSVYEPFGFLYFAATGVPLLIVSLVLAINKDAYGNTLPAEFTPGQSTNQQL